MSYLIILASLAIFLNVAFPKAIPTFLLWLAKISSPNLFPYFKPMDFLENVPGLTQRMQRTLENQRSAVETLYRDRDVIHCRLLGFTETAKALPSNQMVERLVSLTRDLDRNHRFIQKALKKLDRLTAAAFLLDGKVATRFVKQSPITEVKAA